MAQEFRYDNVRYINGAVCRNATTLNAPAPPQKFTDIKVTFDEKDPRIAIVTLNRPDKMNAWRDLGLMVGWDPTGVFGSP